MVRCTVTLDSDSEPEQKIEMEWLRSPEWAVPVVSTIKRVQAYCARLH